MVKPTFLGTRIMVAQVLKQVAMAMPWAAIMAEWRGTVTKEAIAEAVELAQRTFEDHAAEYAHDHEKNAISLVMRERAVSCHHEPMDG
jgi:uncharacterized protein (DUF433 family)